MFNEEGVVINLNSSACCATILMPSMNPTFHLFLATHKLIRESEARLAPFTFLFNSKITFSKLRKLLKYTYQ